MEEDIFDGMTDEDLRVNLCTANLDMEIAWVEHKEAVEYKNLIEEEIERRNNLTNNPTH